VSDEVSSPTRRPRGSRAGASAWNDTCVGRDGEDLRDHRFRPSCCSAARARPQGTQPAQINGVSFVVADSGAKQASAALHSRSTSIARTVATEGSRRGHSFPAPVELERLKAFATLGLVRGLAASGRQWTKPRVCTRRSVQDRRLGRAISRRSDTARIARAARSRLPTRSAQRAPARA